MGGEQSAMKTLKRVNPVGEWKVSDKLGSGSYGTVNKVVSLKSGEMAAAKIVTLQNKDEIHEFEDELKILTRVKHANITNFVDGYLNRKELWIIIDLCEGGSLADIMEFQKGPLNEQCLRCVGFQSSEGLVFLHESGIMHRDIKAANIMLSRRGVVKLGDFGVSALMKSKTGKRNSFIGSPNWMAPEVAQCETNSSKKYNSKADVWSLAVTMIELAQGEPPFNDLHVVKILMGVSAGTVPKFDEPNKHSKELRELLSFCFVKDPANRPSALDVNNHEYCRFQKDRKPLIALVEEVCLSAHVFVCVVLFVHVYSHCCLVLWCQKLKWDMEKDKERKRQSSKRLQALLKDHS
eukprot:m.35208 g.35208  ORF g.35208 m.35208 type:complete len:350 (+) comp9993_c0_seq2:217-1266(+)